MTKKQFIKECGIDEKLINAVVHQSGGWENFKEIASDVANHGADSGFSGWCYYNETCGFFKKNKQLILDFAKEEAESFGESMLEMISHFGVFTHDPISTDDIAEALYSKDNDRETDVHNVMAWYALEEVSRRYYDIVNN